MAIQFQTPVTQPAKTYPDIAIQGLHIVWDNPTQPVRARFVVRPYNAQLNEFSKDSAIVDINDVYATATARAIAEKPELAAALTAVLAAVEQIMNETNPAGMRMVKSW